MSIRYRQPLTVAFLSVSLLAACGKGAPNGQEGAAASQPPPPEVGVVTVEPGALALTEIVPGRLEATRIAEVRARAAGIVLERTFNEGAEVEQGDVLFRIDPAPLRAALNSARATLAKAEANLSQARITEQRYAQLVDSNAISRQEYDIAVATRAQAEAEVEAARAALETARLNLEYATVTAPISGRIGRALVTEGALVGQGEATPMARIQQFDPIYANLTQSSADVLRLRRAFASGKLQRADAESARVTLVMEDGQPYPHEGRLLFTDVTVDPSSGSVVLRAEFPNPEGFLLPGMYVRARIEQAVDQNAITIPQQAVVHTREGTAVMVLDENGMVVARPVQLGRAYQNTWVVETGLQAGDRVIVDGLQKVQPGAPATPVPWPEAALADSAGNPDVASAQLN